MSIAVLLSGGVDSSVALQFLVEEGHDCTAFYLKIWLEDELAHLGRCPWEEDLEYARAVCETLSVPLEIVALQRLYQERIVSELIRQLRSGRTPSPDVWCNRRVKFGAFLDRVEDSFDLVASGHYARLERYDDGRIVLRTATDPVKDQTYFLSQMTQPQLRRCRFPLGSMTKTEVRDRAREAGLPTANRPDSQGICFLGKLRYDEFVEAHLGEAPGPIVEAATGEHLGRHRGFWFYTLGQRRGLGLSGGPWYVVGKDVSANRVLVSRTPLEAGSAADRFLLPKPHWLLENPGPGGYRVKVRHGPRLVGARLEAREGGCVEVFLDEPDPGLAPGQYGVIYDGDRCLGGGEMEVPRAVA